MKNGEKSKKKDFVRIAAAMLFSAFICLGFLFFCSENVNEGRIEREHIEEYFENIYGQRQFIELYGAFQRILGKREIENFTIFKNSYNRLVEPRGRRTSSDITDKVEEVGRIWSFLIENNIPFLYIESPLPINNKSELPLGAIDYSGENADNLHMQLPDMQILQVNKRIDVPEKEMFYKTDHHWSGDASFETYLAVSEWLKENNITEKTIEKSEFERITVNGFLGSYGIKAGKYYAGTEEFVYYRPLFRTKFEFEELTEKGILTGSKTGGWEDSLMDKAILEDPDYNNKYNAFLWGNPGENRITNLNDTNGKKILLISHSYGRPLAQYLALNCREVRQIDPQEGRFEGNYIQYIQEYKPDAVVFLCEFEGEIIGNYKTDD